MLKFTSIEDVYLYLFVINLLIVIFLEKKKIKFEIRKDTALFIKSEITLSERFISILFIAKGPKGK